jgi:heat shock protein HslJ
LPHNKERVDERAAFGTALMGSGNRTYGEQLRGESKGSFLTLAHAFRLAAHPMFSGSAKDIDKPRSAKHESLKIEPKGKGFTFSGRVTVPSNDPPVYAVLGYMDPSGGNDYDATTTTAVPDTDGKFTLECQALAPGKTGELRVVYLQANGQASGFLSSTPYRYPYVVAKDGTVDLAPAIAVLNRPARGGGATTAQAVDTNVPPSISALADTEWTLTDVCGAPVPANSRASLSIGKDGTLSGNAGVNRFNGRARGKDGEFHVGPFMSTKMAGPPELMALEGKFLKALGAAAKFSVDGDTLRVSVTGEAKPLVFTRKAK